MNRKFQFLRQVLCVILVFLSLTALCGCQPEVNGTSIPLSEEKKQEINEAWEAEYGYELIWDNPYVSEYYATYGDCVVFVTYGSQTGVSTQEIAGQKFIYPSAFLLWVYRDGSFMYLEDAYKDGYITKSQIKEMAKYHKSQYESLYTD